MSTENTGKGWTQADGSPLNLSDPKDITKPVIFEDIVDAVWREAANVKYRTGVVDPEAWRRIVALVEAWDEGNQPRQCSVCGEACHCCTEAKCEPSPTSTDSANRICKVCGLTCHECGQASCEKV